MREISLSALQNRQGIFYEINQNEPFTGKVVIKYENGQIRSEKSYKNGKLDGPYNHWGMNGFIEEEGNYKNGEKEGRFVSYRNGQKKSESNYRNGSPEGLQVNWSDNGERSELRLGKGRNHSYKVFYSNGKLKFSGS